jgi:hypothetical protein
LDLSSMVLNIHQQPNTTFFRSFATLRMTEGSMVPLHQ